MNAGGKIKDKNSFIHPPVFDRRYSKDRGGDIRNGRQIFRFCGYGRCKGGGSHDKTGTTITGRGNKGTGEQEAKLNNARNLLDILDEKMIAERIGLPLETVRKLKKEKDR